MIRVVLAEDQAMVLGALAALLELDRDIKVVARARDGKTALDLVSEHRPDVLVSDIEMPIMTGLDLAREVKDRGLQTKVIILTTFGRPGYLRRALDAGVKGYLLKDAPSDRLAEAIRNVQRGMREIDPDLALGAWTEESPLSDREREVLRLAGEGASSRVIAGTLHLSVGTVRNYLSEAIGKMNAGNRIEAARIARQKGWL